MYLLVNGLQNLMLLDTCQEARFDHFVFFSAFLILGFDVHVHVLLPFSLCILILPISLIYMYVLSMYV